MLDVPVGALAAIASALFVAELADKDALLLLVFATRTRPSKVFLAGSLAFLMTTTVIVSFGALLITLVPISWIRLAGGLVMFSYGAFLAVKIARGRTGGGGEDDEGKELAGRSGFLGMLGSLALLDLAGDATEVLTIVLLARFGDPLLVFAGAWTGLTAAVALETALGRTLGRLLTPPRLLYFSSVVFLAVGSFILIPGT